MRPLRWLLAALLGLVAVAALAFAVILGPAHWQIRDVAPPLPDDDALFALAARADGPVALHLLESSTQPMAGRTLGHSIVVVEWADGRRFMIDAGMDREASIAFGELLASLQEAGPVEYFGTADALLGEAVARVDGVGFTHLHVDHVQGIEAFCRARGPGARVYQTPGQAGTHNLHTVTSARTVAESCLEPGTLDGDVVLTTDAFPGLGVVALGGHTPGSTLFVVPVDGTLWLISGDISNVKADLLANRGKGFVYSTFIVPEDTARTEHLRQWLARLDARDDAEVIVAHDVGAARASGL